MGTDKALLELGEETLLSRAVCLCSKVCNEILIGSDSEEHRINPHQLVADELKDCGPIGGIYSCLKQSTNELNFVLSVDAPFVTTGFIKNIVSQSKGFDAVVPVHSGKREPLIALYNKNILNDMKEQLDSGNYKMQFFLNRINTNWVDADEWLKNTPDLFHNLNFPEDIDKGAPQTGRK